MNKPKILLNVFHPDLGGSRGNRILIEEIKGVPGLTINDVYGRYPDGKIDVEREQGLLVEHDLIVFQYPFYWFSSPALFKEWQDRVLDYGFAYPPGEGDKLNGKHWLSVVTVGSREWAYMSGAHMNFTVAELLRPFQQTAYYVGMVWVAPFLVYGVNRPDLSWAASDEEIRGRAAELRRKLEEYDLEEVHSIGPVMPYQLAGKG